MEEIRENGGGGRDREDEGWIGRMRDGSGGLRGGQERLRGGQERLRGEVEGRAR